VKKGDWALPKTVKLSMEGLSCLNALLQHDPDKRIPLDELIYSPYISNDPRTEIATNELQISHVPGQGENLHDVVIANPYAWMAQN